MDGLDVGDDEGNADGAASGDTDGWVEGAGRGLALPKGPVMPVGDAVGAML